MNHQPNNFFVTYQSGGMNWEYKHRGLSRGYRISTEKCRKPGYFAV